MGFPEVSLVLVFDQHSPALLLQDSVQVGEREIDVQFCEMRAEKITEPGLYWAVAARNFKKHDRLVVADFKTTHLVKLSRS